jgi:hypothetical protein
MDGYKRLFLETQPTGGDDADYKVIVVVFTDLPADRAQGVFDDVLQHLAVPSYAADGVLFGPYHEGNEQTAIHNPGFRPFQSPVPFSVRTNWRQLDERCGTTRVPRNGKGVTVIRCTTLRGRRR